MKSIKTPRARHAAFGGPSFEEYADPARHAVLPVECTADSSRKTKSILVGQPSVNLECTHRFVVDKFLFLKDRTAQTSNVGTCTASYQVKAARGKKQSSWSEAIIIRFTNQSASSNTSSTSNSDEGDNDLALAA